MIGALLFDAEGVVIDTEPLWDRGQAEFLRRRGLPYDRARLKPLLAGRSLQESTEALKRELGLRGDTGKLARERADLVRRAFAEEADFVPGFRAFFDATGNGFPTALATGLAPDLLALVDERLGLSALFGGHLYTVADTGRGKPHPDLFLHAAARLGAAVPHCLVLEDAPHGVAAARAAGMWCIGLTTTHPAAHLREADRVVAGYEGLAGVLGDLGVCLPREAP
ncbi:HAD family hydrolase [Thiohalorhabdus sp. Cl-TMA]|uniref:HAD family hydrolase n=1 Tax=Thiohalorhabdus methylotrophus TaxID=3242694 RepID=A0ABV4TRK0_9GAMM